MFDQNLKMTESRRHIEMKFQGEELVVTGVYDAGEKDNRDTPGTPERFRIEKVELLHEKTDITATLAEYYINEDKLEEHILDHNIR